MKNNIIRDQGTIWSAIKDDQEATDAFSRLIGYSDALEVQNGYLSDFADDMQDAQMLANTSFAGQYVTLRNVVNAAEQDVEDNYALLDETVQAVKQREVEKQSHIYHFPICCRNCDEGKDCYWRQTEIEDRLERI